MQGKVVVLTGGTSGIGQFAAQRLAAMGARIVLVARSKSRGEATLGRLRQIAPAQKHSIHYGDVSRLPDLKRLSAEIASAEPRIDVLINNAGAMFSQRKVTDDGFELTFATNHLSYFALTNGLMERLIQSAPSRVINTSSHAHYRATLDFDDLQSEHNYGGFPVYCRSKLMNLLFTRSLAKRLEGTGVVTNSFHPGFVKTRFGDDSGGWTGRMFGVFKLFAISEEKGADTLIYLASAKEVSGTSGRYFYKRKPVEPSKLAKDDAAAARLWNETARLAGIPA